ncbi:MAG: bifunctional acetate--CoA ligase family protein/GNAT family N-acetyltransferase [Pseudomonadota bacterium]
MSIRNLDALFAPRSVTLIGASARQGSLGHVALNRLRSGGFQGRLSLVNPKYRDIDGMPVAASVDDLQDVPDLGIIVTPAQTVPDIIADLGAAGSRAAIVISAGFDPALRQRMLDAAQPHLLRIIGPNCLGFQVPHIGLDASFAHLAPAKGGLALLSQSGAIVTAMLDWAAARGIGFSVTASLGDMADIDVGDMLDYLAADRQTKAILLYLEQVTDARKFMSAARSASRAKPVIAVKAGRSAAAARAAASHTGALAGSDEIYDAALRRAGIIRVTDLEEMFDAAEALSRVRPVASDQLMILTNGGGAGVLGADAAAAAGVDLAVISAETRARLDAILPATWSGANPVDIIGDADAARYSSALETLLKAPEADLVLVMNCPTGLASSLQAAEAVVAVKRVTDRPKPIFATWLGEATSAAGAAALAAANIPVFRTPAQAVRGISYLTGYRQSQRQLMRCPPATSEEEPADREAALCIINDVIGEGRTILTEPEAKDVLAAYHIPAVETRIVASPDEAEAAARDMLNGGGDARLAMKILSRDISHKSDVGGVHLDLASPEDVRIGALAMLSRITAEAPDARIDGLVLQPMIRRPGAHELIIGLNDDRVFGPVVLFGAGGVSVEVVADKALSLPPLDTMLAGDMIDRTRIGKLLKGYRDRPAANRTAIEHVLVRISQMAAELPSVVELDINPLLADDQGVIALDARIVVKPGQAVSRLAIRPYPAEWTTDAICAKGPVLIRPIRPADEALYPDFIDRLSKQDIKFRFFGAFSHASHEQIARFTQIDYARAMAFIAIDPQDGSLLGVSRLAADPNYETAEFAILVRSDRQKEGIGRALMRQLLDYARAEGIQTLQGDVMTENTPMQILCSAFGFQHDQTAGSRGQMRFVARLKAA